MVSMSLDRLRNKRSNLGIDRRVKAIGGLGAALGAGAGVVVTLIVQRLSRRGGVTRIADKAGKWGRKGIREARQRARYLEGQVEGVRARAERLGEEGVPPNDRTLALKVESEVLRGDFPGVSVNAEESVVQLRGQVESGDAADDLVRRVRRVDGVKDVENLLHLPGEMPPNKEAAMRASR